MSAEKIAGELIDALNQMEVAWMLVGSFSSNYYGLPRSTQDVDFVIRLGERSIRELIQLLGEQYRLDPQMSFETVTATKRYQVSHSDSEFMVELFLLSDDPYDQQRFSRRISASFKGRQVYFPTVEDVVVTKIQWAHIAGRRKDEDDVTNVLIVQSGKIDWPYVESWCDRHGTRGTLDRVRRAAGF